MGEKTRRFDLDNLKFFLIFCVVFGHLIEVSPSFAFSGLIYQVIYSFHMPLFVFLFGYFARYDRAKLLRGYILPYVVFQVLYIAYSNRFLHSSLPYQFTTPFWLL